MATLKYKNDSGEYIAIPSVQGPAGISVTDIKQTTASSESGGENIWTVTLSNGVISNFTVKNGEIGPIGPRGPAGGIQDVVASTNEGYITVTNADGTTKEIMVGTAGDFLPLTGGTLTGELISTTPNGHRIIGGDYGFILRNDGESIWFLLTAAGNQYGTWNDLRPLRINCIDGTVTCSTVLYGAAWNDYAEYRETKYDVKPGRVVCENGDDTLSQTHKRLQPACSIVSDTFGFAIGKTKKCKTPLAAAGRVLAYPYEDRNSYKPGDAVCSGPNGTVSKMTCQEKVMYPECIIGYVSCVPTYETWGEKDTKVDGRIWIKVI